ncbi:hypothetical protein PB2503_03082 [Parvularcula bermudensis HTCC2503]|uniref:DUF1134 domain-containing protein n=1 Tax=Parvularcula bermudensis (strain ATCC BAA-594 / HTCC2503 / KCTC 12087) TaxID=314260 RepID=E0TD34_PARBH|nr:EipA family protein [Parvularcula bermudensis]ADM08693.1 hypothetical protein PB2503_03082 [Parvularcula bermudensis HTCC2503]
MLPRLLLAAVAPLALVACQTAPTNDVERVETKRDLQYPTYARGTVVSEAENFFGQSSAELAELLADIFEDEGQPQAYIAGEEIGGAVGVGVTYGRGQLYRPGQPPLPIYWRGPSLGFDLGADASKVFTLVYDLGPTANLFQRFPGGEGAAYFIGGIGAEALTDGTTTIVPIRTGIGARTGVNIGYMHFSNKRSWIPL